MSQRTSEINRFKLKHVILGPILSIFCDIPYVSERYPIHLVAQARNLRVIPGTSLPLILHVESIPRSANPAPSCFSIHPSLSTFTILLLLTQPLHLTDAKFSVYSTSIHLALCQLVLHKQPCGAMVKSIIWTNSSANRKRKQRDEPVLGAMPRGVYCLQSSLRISAEFYWTHEAIGTTFGLQNTHLTSWLRGFTKSPGFGSGTLNRYISEEG